MQTWHSTLAHSHSLVGTNLLAISTQSFPTFATYAEATSLKDWQVDNPMTGFRNRRFGNGLEMFEKQFKRHFRLPTSCERKPQMREGQPPLHGVRVSCMQPSTSKTQQPSSLCCCLCALSQSVSLPGSAPEDPQAAFKLFRSFFYITHMQQARCYETGINYWRRLRSHPPGAHARGLLCCMHALHEPVPRWHAAVAARC